MNWYLDVIKNKYAQFSGRARRKEYWMFVVFNILAAILLAIVDSLTGTMSEEGTGLFGALYSLAVLIPSIAVAVRRLHDTARSGWWLLIVLTGIGIFVILVFMCLEGTAGDNEYGPSPKTEAEPGLAGA